MTSFFDTDYVTESDTPRVQQTRIRPDGWERPGAVRDTTPPVLLGTFPDQSPQWHAARRGRLGGSEVAALVGLSKWESRFSLWHRKQEHLPEPEPSTPVDWGRRLEDVVREHFARMHPELSVFTSGTWVHGSRDWQLANPDALAHEITGQVIAVDGSGTTTIAGPRRVVEVKTALYDYAWGPHGTDEIPIYYRTQVMHYMDVLGADLAHVAVLIGGHDYREYVIPYDAQDAAYLREEAAAFMESLRDGVEPAPDDHVRTQAAMEHLHPDLEDRLDVPVTREQAMAFVTAEREKDAAAAAWAGEKARMIQTMGRARRAMLGGQTVATRIKSSAGNVYVKGHPGWKAKAPLPTPVGVGDITPGQRAMLEGLASGMTTGHAPEAEAHSRHVAENILTAAKEEPLLPLGELLAGCSRRSDVEGVMALFPDPSPEQRDMGVRRWRELPNDDKK